jgi:hypothetical protein
VKVWTPGWIVADDGGAHADATAGTIIASDSAPVEHASATSFLKIASSNWTIKDPAPLPARGPCPRLPKR